jgi:hypothetical protein
MHVAEYFPKVGDVRGREESKKFRQAKCSAWPLDIYLLVAAMIKAKMWAKRK